MADNDDYSSIDPRQQVTQENSRVVKTGEPVTIVGRLRNVFYETMYWLRRNTIKQKIMQEYLESVIKTGKSLHELENLGTTLIIEDDIAKMEAAKKAAQYQADIGKLGLEMDRLACERKRVQEEHEMEIERIRAQKRKYEQEAVPQSPPPPPSPKPPQENISDPETRRAYAKIKNIIEAITIVKPTVDEGLRLLDEMIKNGDIDPEEGEYTKNEILKAYNRTVFKP